MGAVFDLPGFDCHLEDASVTFLSCLYVDGGGPRAVDGNCYGTRTSWQSPWGGHRASPIHRRRARSNDANRHTRFLPRAQSCSVCRAGRSPRSILHTHHAVVRCVISQSCARVHVFPAAPMGYPRLVKQGPSSCRETSPPPDGPAT